MTHYVELLYDDRIIETRSARSDDKWDRGDTRTTWYFRGAKIADQNSYQTVPYEGELKRGDTVWCVFATYSTGDSFGHDENSRLEFIAVHKDPDKAYETKKRWEGDSTHWITDQGTEVKIGWRPWDGYFESLEQMYVEPYILR